MSPQGTAAHTFKMQTFTNKLEVNLVKRSKEYFNAKFHFVHQILYIHWYLRPEWASTPL